MQLILLKNSLITQEEIIIKNIGKKPILADVSFWDNAKSKPIVIFCHGYKGFKDWGAWNLVAEYFAKAGFIFLKFNFSHNGGTIDQPIDFPDEDSFGRNTYSKEVEDTDRVIDFVSLNYNSASIYLIGHSRGGGIATLVAGQNNSVQKLVTWAAVSDFKSRFPVGEKLQKWKNEGVMHVVNGRTGQNLPHYFSFYEDFSANEDILDITRWASLIKIPHLILHGINDEAVSFEEALHLHLCNPNSDLVKLETNHTFNTKHPWDLDSLSGDLEKVCDETCRFLRG